MKTLIAVFLLGLTPLLTARASTVIWQGASGGFQVKVTADDISATDSSGKTVMSLKKDFDEATKKDMSEAEEGWESSTSYTPRSLVGPYLTLEVFTSAYLGGAHPMAGRTFTTIDLRSPEKPVTLLAWYDDKTVAGELAKDKVLKKYLTLKKGTAITMANLEKNFTEPEDCKFALTASSVDSFAFFSVEKDKVAVRVGLSHACEVARGSLTQFGILLPIPAALASDLKAANEQKAGFLMKHAKHLFTQPVNFQWEFASSKTAPH